MTDENPKEKPALTDTANGGFKIRIGEPSNGNLPEVVDSDTPAAETSGGLTYANATDDERVIMDKIIASIDLTNPDTITDLGSEQRTQLGNLSDQILDSIQPELRLAFAEAIRQLVDLIRANSLEEIKKRIADGSLRRAGDALISAFTHRDNQVKIDASKRMIEHFMTDITGTRKSIQKVTNNLVDQKVALNQNYVNINKLGAGMNEAAQGLRIVHAATEEKIRRIKSGEDTVLKDLEAKAEKGRPDDIERQQTAQATWGVLREQDASLLGSIATYEKNVATLAFTKQANIRNRIKTQNALSNIVEEWKAGLAMFAEMTVEGAAEQLLEVVDQLTAQADKQQKEMFDMLVDSVVKNTGKADRSLRQIITDQTEMAAKLAAIGPEIDAHYAALENDVAALKVSSAAFRSSVVHTFSKPGGVMGGTPPTPGGPT